jgi:hypothetical protein
LLLSCLTAQSPPSICCTWSLFLSYSPNPSHNL